MKSKGVKKGDVVTLYMPMVPELAMTMLAWYVLRHRHICSVRISISYYVTYNTYITLY